MLQFRICQDADKQLLGLRVTIFPILLQNSGDAVYLPGSAFSEGGFVKSVLRRVFVDQVIMTLADRLDVLILRANAGVREELLQIFWLHIFSKQRLEKPSALIRSPLIRMTCDVVHEGLHTTGKQAESIMSRNTLPGPTLGS